MLRSMTVLAAAAMAVVLATPASAQSRVKVGTLTCDISGGAAFVIGSRKEVRCIFSPSNRNWQRERYVGAISRLGLDLGVTAGGRLIWAVYAPTRAQRYALAGSYGGASAEATLGAGVGANALVGGSNRTVTLQPLSVQGQAGVSLAAGVAGLTLQPAR